MNPYNTLDHFVKKHAAAAAAKNQQRQPQQNPRSEYAANRALVNTLRNTQEK